MKINSTISKNKCALCIATVVIVAVVFVHFIAYFFTRYPEAISDTMKNQEITSGHSQPKRKYQFSEWGKMEMSRSSVTLIGVGIDPGKIMSFLPNVENLSKQFKESRIIFATENTNEAAMIKLQSWVSLSAHNRSIVVSDVKPEEELLREQNGTRLPREGRIARARNSALAEYRKGMGTNYLINFDSDIIGWNFAGIQDSFGQSSQWDVVCSNGVILYGIYRDIYAVRAPGIVTNHHLSGLDHNAHNISTAEQKINRKIFTESKRKVHQIMEKNQKNAKDVDLIKLDSCFGGMAIYKADAIQNCSYSHQHSTPPYVVDCEHVLFHQCLAQRNQARIATNPNMKVWYGHTALTTINWQRVYDSIFGA